VYDHDDLGADDLMGARSVPMQELVEQDWQVRDAGEWASGRVGEATGWSHEQHVPPAPLMAGLVSHARSRRQRDHRYEYALFC